MKKLILGLIMVSLFAMIGCQHLPISIQVVGDQELASIDQVVINTIIEVVKAKYPDRVDRIVRYCDLALESPDDQFEAYFNNGLKMLPDLFINDPEIRGAVKGFLGSFKINVDTESVIFDSGALRRARQIVQMLRDGFVDRVVQSGYREKIEARAKNNRQEFVKEYSTLKESLKGV